MRSSRQITIVCAHAEGEVGRVVTGGVLPPPGATLLAQRAALMEDGALARFLLNEPRGGVFAHANLLLPPRDPRADAAFITMEPEGWPLMSGSNAICVATVLLETGMVPMAEPVTRLTLETPAGLVPVEAACSGGRCAAVTIESTPAHVIEQGRTLDVPGLGRVACDIAWGGAVFALVDPAPLGLALEPEAARELVVAAERIRRAAGPEVEFTGFVGPLARDPDGTLTAVHAITVPPGKIDRSPCGTGTSARMAVLHARGRLAVGEPFLARSLLGTSFRACVVRTTAVDGRPAIVPRLTGRAWITAIHHELLDPEDPFPRGYRMADTWPQA
jgi:proline racemase